MNQIGGLRKRKMDQSSAVASTAVSGGYPRNSRLGKSQAHPLGGKGAGAMLPHNPLTDSRAFDS